MKQEYEIERQNREQRDQENKNSKTQTLLEDKTNDCCAVCNIL